MQNICSLPTQHHCISLSVWALACRAKHRRQEYSCTGRVCLHTLYSVLFIRFRGWDDHTVASNHQCFTTFQFYTCSRPTQQVPVLDHTLQMMTRQDIPDISRHPKWNTCFQKMMMFYDVCALWLRSVCIGWVDETITTCPSMFTLSGLVQTARPDEQQPSVSSLSWIVGSCLMV